MKTLTLIIISCALSVVARAQTQLVGNITVQGTTTTSNITAPSTTNLTISGGSSGATITLGQGASGNVTYSGAGNRTFTVGSTNGSGDYFASLAFGANYGSVAANEWRSYNGTYSGKPYRLELYSGALGSAMMYFDFVGKAWFPAGQGMDVAGAFKASGVIQAGSGPTTLTDSAGKVLSAALNTVQPAQGGTGITSLGTGVATALGVNTGSAGAFQVNNASGASLTSLTAANIVAGALANGMTATTQTANDGSTKLATTLYADTAAAARGNVTNSGTLASGNIVVGGGTTVVSTTATGTGVVTALGVNTNSAGGFSPIDGTATLTNKRVTPRVNTVASSATPTINTDTTDMFTITAQAAAITSMTSSLSGTPTAGQKLIIRILDNGTARAITWGASYASRGATLPTTTVLSKYLYVSFIWNEVASVWDCVGVAQEL